MKRILSIAMIVVLCAAFMVTAAFADGAAALSVTSATGEAGDTVVLTVSVSEAEFATYGVKVQCPEGLEIVSFEQGAASKGFFSATASTGIASAVNSEDYTANGVLFTVTLKIKDAAEAGDYTVNVVVDNFTTVDLDAVGVSGSYGTVTVEATTPPTEEPTTPPTEEPTTPPTEEPSTPPTEEPTTPPTEEPTTPPVEPTTPVTPSDPTVSDKTGDNVLLFIGIGIVVLAAAAVIFTRKQKA